jgi:hypothetical protein
MSIEELYKFNKHENLVQIRHCKDYEYYQHFTWSLASNYKINKKHEILNGKQFKKNKRHYVYVLKLDNDQNINTKTPLK